MREAMIRYASATLLVATAVLSQGLHAGNPSVVNEQTVDQLVRALGDKNFKVRDSAARRLTELEAIPDLVNALKSSDPEVARLARKILDDLQRSATLRSLDHLRREAIRGEASRVIERFARWNGPDNDESSWQIIIDFAWDIADRAIKGHPAQDQFWPVGRSPIKSTNQYSPKKFDGQVVYLHSNERVTYSKPLTGYVRANGIVFKSGSNPRGVFVSCDGMELQRDLLFHSIVLVVGRARFDSQLFNSIVICDGDVELGSGLSNSVVIASGSVKYLDAVGSSVIVSSSSISTPDKRRAPVSKVVFRENEPNPFGFAKWFTTAEAGLDVATEKGGVRVEKLRVGKLPAKSGLKVGDLVLSLDGTKIDSTEKFRQRLLRGVVNEHCILMVKRDDRIFDIKLDFRAEELAAKQKKDR